jgi:MFS family permease
METMTATAGPDRDAGLIHGLILACVPTTIVMTTCVMLPIQPAMIKSFPGLPGAADLVSLAVVLPTLTVAVSSLAAGVVGEWIGRRRLLILATAVFAVAAILPVWLSSMTLILVSRGVAGLAVGAMITSAVALTGDYYSGAALQRWLAAQGAAGALSAVIVSFIAGAIAEVNWRYCFLLLLVGALLLLALVLTPAPKFAAAAHNDETAAAHAAAASAQPAPWAMWAAIFAVAVTGTLIIFPPAYELGYLLVEKALGSSFLTGIATSILAAGAVGGAFSLTALRRLPPAARVALAIASAAAGSILMAMATALVPMMIGGALVGVGQGMLGPILSVWLLEGTPERLRGRAVGVLQTASFLTVFAAPLIARRLAVAEGSSSAVMRLCALADVLMVLALAPAMIRRRPAASAAAAG